MLDLLAPATVGIIAGFVSGFIPGIGNFAALLVLFPFLYNLDPLQILILYVALTTISQYIGSIPAITYGVPGESSSLPAVIESKNLKNPAQIYQAIIQSAIGSTFGGLVVLGCTWLAIDYLAIVMNFFDTKIQLILYLSMFLIMIFIVTSNKIIVNILFVSVGILLGLIGYNRWLETTVFTFGYHDLYSGLPLVVVVIILLGVPEVLKNYGIKQNYKKLDSVKTKIKFNLISSTWYSFIGFIGGLAPGLTTTMSSQLAYMLSKFHTKDPVERITASETANNAGAFSQLIPLIMLGIPLIGSEALILNVMEAKGFRLGNNNFLEIFQLVGFALVVINIIGLILAWPLAKHITKLFSVNMKILYSFIFISLIMVIIWIGWTNYQLDYYLIISICLLPIAFIIKKYDTMPLIFAFLVHDRIFELAYRFYLLNV